MDEEGGVLVLKAVDEEGVLLELKAVEEEGEWLLRLLEEGPLVVDVLHLLLSAGRIGVWSGGV